MMRKIFVLLVLSLMAIPPLTAEAAVGLTSNASPTIVSVSAASPTQEVTFPQIVRNVSVFNYDTDDGLWVNFRGGDTKGIARNADRFYLGPSGVISLSDYQTVAITCIYDNQFTSGTASPVSVIATY